MKKNTSRISSKEKVLYGIAGLGQNIIYVVVGSFLMFFLTDVYGIDPIAAGTMMMVVRIWDAINDPIMGIIVERTRTRWGKLRPYILFSLLPIALFTVLNFLAPNFGNPTLQLVWCYAVYILWDFAYTMSDIPFWGLSAAMTNDTTERTKLLTLTRILTMAGMAIGIVGIPILIGALGGATTPEAVASVSKSQNIMAYTLMALICSVVGCGLFSFAFFCTRERFTEGSIKVSVAESLKNVLKNVPLLLVMLASTLGFGRQMVNISGMYVAMWTFKSMGYYSLLGGVIMAATILAIAITPLFLKLWSKKQLFIYSSLFGVLTNIALFFVGRWVTHGSMQVETATGIYLCIGFLFATSLAGGFHTILETAMIGDSVDYLEWKTGVRAEGLCYSGQTFVTKLVSALCSFVFGLMLSASGYVANAATEPIQALNAIFSSVSVWPAIGCALSILPILWYTVDDTAHRKYVDEINARKALESKAD